MFKKGYFSFLVILTFSCSSLLAQNYKSAHAIIINKIHDHEYILLGKMRGSKQLSTFGGLRDHGESDPKATCAREVEEESLGVLGNKKAIGKLLQGAIQISGFYNGHICYVVPAKFYGDGLSYKFRHIRNDIKNKLSYSQKEMIDIIAIRVDVLKSKFANGQKITFPDNEGVQCSLRNPTKAALQAAIDKGCF